jgi:hypothetical protein
MGTIHIYYFWKFNHWAPALSTWWVKNCLALDGLKSVIK